MLWLFSLIIPGGDIGIVFIFLTILVKVLLFPLSGASIKSQAKMNLLAPELNKIKKVEQINRRTSKTNL